MERDRAIVAGGGQLSLDVGFLGFQGDEASIHRRRGRTLADRIDEAFHGAADLAQAAGQRRAAIAAFGGGGMPFGVVGADIGGHGLGRQHAVAQAGQNPILDLGALDAPAVGASCVAFVDVVRTHQPAVGFDRVVAAAVGALQQARKQAGLMAGGQGRVAGRAADREPRLDSIPGGLIDDRQMRDGHAPPFRLGPDALDLLAGGAILAHVEPVPDLDPDIDFAAQDAVAAMPRAHDGAGVPDTALRPWDVVAVQLVGDLAAGVAFAIGGEDPANDLGLVVDDGLGAPGRCDVAVKPRSGGQALLGVGVHAALGLGRQAFQEKFAGQALEGHVHDLDVVVGEGGDPDADVLEAVEDVGLVFEVPRDPFLILGQDQVEAAGLGLGEHLVKAGAVGHRRSADRRVRERADDGPAARLGMPPTEGQLVSDRPFVLAVVGISGVERGAHGSVDVSRAQGVLLGAGIVPAGVGARKGLDDAQHVRVKAAVERRALVVLVGVLGGRHG